MEGTDSRLTGSYRQRSNAIRLCYEVAKSKGYSIFALQHGGQCFAGGGEEYMKHGKATNCGGGKGGGYANSVYSVIGGKGRFEKYVCVVCVCTMKNG